MSDNNNVSLAENIYNNFLDEGYTEEEAKQLTEKEMENRE